MTFLPRHAGAEHVVEADDLARRVDDRLDVGVVEVEHDEAAALAGRNRRCGRRRGGGRGRWAARATVAGRASGAGASVRGPTDIVGSGAGVGAAATGGTRTGGGGSGAGASTRGGLAVAQPLRNATRTTEATPRFSLLLRRIAWRGLGETTQEVRGQRAASGNHRAACPAARAARAAARRPAVPAPGIAPAGGITPGIGAPSTPGWAPRSAPGGSATGAGPRLAGVAQPHVHVAVGAVDHDALGVDRLDRAAGDRVADPITRHALGAGILEVRDGGALAQHDAEQVRLRRRPRRRLSGAGGVSVRVGLNRFRAATDAYPPGAGGAVLRWSAAPGGAGRPLASLGHRHRARQLAHDVDRARRRRSRARARSARSVSSASRLRLAREDEPGHRQRREQLLWLADVYYSHAQVLNRQ